MNRITYRIIPFLAIASLGGPVFSAEPPSLATIYVQVSTAQAKADAALVALGKDIQTGLELQRRKLENAQQKANQIYSSLMSVEEKKGEMKNQSLLDSIQTIRTKVETEWRAAGEAREVQEAAWRRASELDNQLRSAFKSLADVNRSLKDAQLDIAPISQLYDTIAAKAIEADTEAKNVLAAYTALCKTWDDIVTEADGFGK